MSVGRCYECGAPCAETSPIYEENGCCSQRCSAVWESRKRRERRRLKILDTYIARKVMGWKRNQEGRWVVPNGATATHITSRGRKTVVVDKLQGWAVDHPMDNIWHWSPSTSHDAAMEVVAHLAKYPNSLHCLTSYGFDGNLCAARFARGVAMSCSPLALLKECHRLTEVASAQAETLPLAICLAAKQAAGKRAIATRNKEA